MGLHFLAGKVGLGRGELACEWYCQDQHQLCRRRRRRCLYSTGLYAAEKYIFYNPTIPASTTLIGQFQSVVVQSSLTQKYCRLAACRAAARSAMASKEGAADWPAA